MKPLQRELAKSFAYWDRALKVVPAGSQTLSKAPDQFVKGVYPVYLKSGRGSHVFDVDGNEYIDYIMALGAITLGYGYPCVVEAISRQLKDGITFSLMHPLEVEVSELLIEVIPCAEMVRFGKNGADATSAAVRVARAYTGREKVACCGYHGYQDWYVITTARNMGVPSRLREYIFPFIYNDIDSLEKVLEENEGQIAAVIMEPVEIEQPKDDFLSKVMELSHKHGAVLIFDEMVTGFRVALGGAQEYFGVTPDLACFGKGMANGMPLSAVVGSRGIMKLFDKVFFSTTFGGETLSLAAAKTTITEMLKNDVIGYFRKQGGKLQDSYNRLAQETGVNTKCAGLPAHMALRFEKQNESTPLEMKGLFLQEMVKRGKLVSEIQYLCYSHSDDDIDATIEAYGDSLTILGKAVRENGVKAMLEGEIAQGVFRRPHN